MKSEQVFIGDIRKCTKFDRQTLFTVIDPFCCSELGHIEYFDELYKKDAILIRVAERSYVDLNSYQSLLNHIKIFLEKNSTRVNLDGLVMPLYAYCTGNLFVDEKTLRPYYENQEIENISARKLLKQINSPK